MWLTSKLNTIVQYSPRTEPIFEIIEEKILSEKSDSIFLFSEESSTRRGKQYQTPYFALICTFPEISPLLFALMTIDPLFSLLTITNALP